MMPGLPAIRLTAIGAAMRFALLRFMLLFAVLATGIHAPAMAHQDTPVINMHQHVHEVSQNDSDDNAPSDWSNDALQHHHCPAGMMEGDAQVPAAPFVARDVLAPAPATALASRATAPPTEPPLA